MLIIHNATKSVIHVESETTVQPRHSASLHLKGAKSILIADSADDQFVNLPLKLPFPARGHRKRWQCLPWKSETRWRGYILKTRIPSKATHLLLLPRRDLRSFLSDISNDTPLSDILLPGTHDTVAYFGYPFSQCQTPSFPLTSQLQSGVRVLDIRLAVVSSTLIAYHGIISQRVSFSSLLRTISAFLSSREGRNETIVMSVKQEDGPRTPGRIFDQLMKEAIFPPVPHADDPVWFLENRIPCLGEVRGKIVLFARFGNPDNIEWPGGRERMGIKPGAWPDSAKEGFEWWCKETKVVTQDWYAIPSFLSIPEKFARATSILTSPSSSSSTNPTLAISYTSAASFPLALPQTIALGLSMSLGFVDLGFKGVNERLRNWLLGTFADSFLQQQPSNSDKEDALMTQFSVLLEKQQTRESLGDLEEKKMALSSEGQEEEKRTRKDEDVKIRGWILMDFVDVPDDLLPLFVECNFR